MPDGAYSDDPAVQAQLDRLNALSPGRDVLGLERITQLLARLGNPHHQLPPVFHVAGTNGKGSVCAFLRAMLEAYGKRVHAYTSPHLVRFNERIRVAGELISDAALAPLLKEAIDAADGTGASFFEVTTAAAFLAFTRMSADACVIEVGLGGRLDATNVVAAPAVCGIAALGIDHEAFLLAEEAGAPVEAMERIGWEKAGISKAHVPLVTQAYDTHAAQGVAQAAGKAGAVLLRRGCEWEAWRKADGLSYRDSQGALDLPLPALPGVHQADSAALAVAMLRHQRAVTVSETAMAQGLRRTTWPARLQRLSPGPLTALLPDTDIWLDGGHNRSAGEALAAHFADLPDASLHLIIGMLSNKAPDALIAPLSQKLASVTVVPVPGHAWHKAEAFGPEAVVADNVAAALKQLKPCKDAMVLIGGSLYLAGEVLRANRQFPD